MDAQEQDYDRKPASHRGAARAQLPDFPPVRRNAATSQAPANSSARNPTAVGGRPAPRIYDGRCDPGLRSPVARGEAQPGCLLLARTAARTRLMAPGLPRPDSSCSQRRSTNQPRLRSTAPTSLSRARLAASLRFQKPRLVAGVVACLGQECQKQPSTKTASLSFGNRKSGWPNNLRCLRHPAILFSRKSRAKAISVVLFPRPRTRAMTIERCSCE